jgi:hypothetical protein
MAESQPRTAARAAIAILLGLLSSGLAVAQPPTAKTLDKILQALQENLDRYDARLPSFFCDEHAVSQVFPGERRDNTVTDSIFRLKRIVDSNRATNFDESREIKLVNGQEPGAQDPKAPMSLDGAFEGGLAVVSLDQQSCMRYTLERIGPKRSPTGYIVRFASQPNPPRPGECLIQESAKGRVLIDPNEMQITRMELTVPHHVIHAGNPHDKGEWTVSVDYKPVLLDAQTFWMPAAISSSTTSGAGTYHSITWSFQADYRNYHKLEVTSRIVPATE